MDFADVNIDQRFHKHIIGKAGQNSKLQKLTFILNVVSWAE